MVYSRPLRCACGLALALAVAAFPPDTAQAADSDWNTGTANWSAGGSWTPGEPTLDNDAVINNGGTAQITSGNTEYADDLFLGDTSGHSGYVSMSGGSLYVEHDEYVGYDGTGTFTQGGGENRCSYGLSHYDLYLGYSATGNGTYTMTNGTLYAGDQYIGRLGTGTFYQSGGTNHVSGTGSTVADSMYIGYASASGGGNGTYRLSGSGQLTFDDEDAMLYVGCDASYLGTGRFEWFRPAGISIGSGGDGKMSIGTLGTLAMGYSFDAENLMSGAYVPITGLNNATLEVTNGATVTKDNAGITAGVKYLRIGSSTGGGTGNLSAGTVSVGQAEYVGDDGGIGVINHTGGSHEVATHLYLGRNLGSGTYNLSNSGSLTVPRLHVGYGGTGLVHQTGGTCTIGNYLYFAEGGGIGSYELDAGSLYVGAAFTDPGGNGTFIFDGGSLTFGGAANMTVTNFHIARDGGTNVAASLAAGDSLTVAAESIGHSGAGSLTQNGGTHTISGSLTLGGGGGGGGICRLNGGTMNVAQIANGAGTGTLILNGGTFNPSGFIDVDNWTIAQTATVAFTQSASSYTVGTLTLAAQAGSQGTYTLAGGTLHATGPIQTGGGTGTLVLNGGTAAFDDDISVTRLKVGDGATASFAQINHTYTVGEDLTVGAAGGNGTYRLAGGSLDVGDDILVGAGGTGRFEWVYGSLDMDSIVLSATGTLAMGVGFDLDQMVAGGKLQGLDLGRLEIIYGATGTQDAGSVTAKHLQLGGGGGGGGAGTFVLTGPSTQLTIPFGGSLRIGADGHAGRLDWRAGSLSSPGMTFGAAGTLAMGFGIELADLNDGSLYGGSAPTGLNLAALELNGGHSTHGATSTAVATLRLGAAGAASCLMSDGTLSAGVVEIGLNGAGVFVQTGGTATVSVLLTVGAGPHGGTYGLRGAALQGNDLTVRRNPDSVGTFTGFGTVGMAGRLINNGRIVADANGVAGRELNLSSFSTLWSRIENDPAERHGWGAQNAARLVLPSIHVDPGACTRNWGESPFGLGPMEDAFIDLVNSAQLAFHGVAQPLTLSGSLLAADHADVPSPPPGWQFIGVWDFHLSEQDFDHVDLTIRYDHVRAGELGIDEEDLQLYHYDAGQWMLVTTGIDATNKWITADGLTSLSPIAVGVPEPTTLAFLGAGAALLLRRRRKANTGH